MQIINRLSVFWKRNRTLTKFFTLFFLCFTLVVGCNPNNQPSTTVDSANSTAGNPRVTFGTTLKPRTIDPADSYELAGLNIIYNLGDTLYTYELGETELKPSLATEMPEVSEDGLTYKIPLRTGVTFHDGTPFNAEAMAFSLQRFIENGGKPSFLLADTVESVEATGENELTIKLKKPFAAFPSLLAFPGTSAISPEAYQIGAGEFNPNTFVGTGPYKLADYSSDSIRLDVFADYWGEKPVNEGVDLQIYAGNSANLFNGFRTGAVDVAYQSFDPEQIKSLLEGAENDQWQAIEAPGTAVSYMVLNLNQEPLDQPEVRQAIAATMDRALINERVLQGQAEPLYSMVPTSFEAYQPTFQTEYGDANVEKAKELLTEAGYSPDNPITIEVWHPSGSKIRSLVATTLKAYGEQKLEGIIQFVPKSVESATAFSNLPKGIYPTFLVDWYPDFLDPDNYIQPFLDCAEGSAESGCQSGGSQTQGSFYYSERINELIDKQRSERDPEVRKAIFADIQETLAEDVPYIPLWQNKEYAFAQNGVDGVTINPSQNFPFWTIEK
ncbi:ABC transporter substrate-binding protein [Oscillatoria salina]|uniref:ABC transporter substrate-binding protein n=1 Tax=Oscillatoria salina TaxID=331517 RepID=UPI001CCD4187|nr:ABC transporter substrate-binding protein [Oscillatoria salina]